MSEEDNTIFGYSTSRIVALLTPVLATVMGGLAAWLFQHFPGLDSIVDEESTAAGLTTGGIWIATAFLTYAISHKWLDGLSKWERRIFGALPVTEIAHLEDDPGVPVVAQASDPGLGERVPPPLDEPPPPTGDLTKFHPQ